MTLLAKGHCFLIQSGLSKVFWAEDTTMSTYLVNRSPSSANGFKTPTNLLGFLGWLASIKQEMLELIKVKNMGFNESGEYKKIFTGSGVGTGSMQVLHGFEFEVEPLGDHTFELARDREQHLACKLFRYREDNNEATFAVAAVDKIYAHESLSFNDTVACESEIWVTKGLLVKAKGNVLGLEIIKDRSGNTLRVLQSRIHNKKLVQTLLEEHSILSLKDGLSGDYDVEKNGKWSYRYAVGSQEYQVICMIPDIASVGVDMLDGVRVDDTGYEGSYLDKGTIGRRTKHINVRYHFIGEVLEAKTVKFLKVGTEHNVADALTKVGVCFDLSVSLDVEDITFDVYDLPCFSLVLFVTTLFIHAL
ncbi:hypothetical protein Tco_0666122 [Tanacetum coccineum]